MVFLCYTMPDGGFGKLRSGYTVIDIGMTTLQIMWQSNKCI